VHASLIAISLLCIIYSVYPCYSVYSWKKPTLCFQAKIDVSIPIWLTYRGILVYNICLISISNSVSDGATNKSVLNIESS